GKVFRNTRWGDLECILLCRTGFSDDCSEELAEEHCYRELSFSIAQDGLDRGDYFTRAGFALGNFNYRIDSLALNFVGTDVRDCSESSLPQTCHSAGFVPYSIAHIGPYEVRNHAGENFEV